MTDWQVEGRPQHPDFMHLADVVLSFDARATEGGEDIHSLLRGVIDVESLGYMARQRAKKAMEIAGVVLDRETEAAAETVIASIFVNAFAVGVGYERRYGSKPKIAPFRTEDFDEIPDEGEPPEARG